MARNLTIVLSKNTDMRFLLDKKDNFVVVKLEEDKLDALMAPELKSELVFLHSEGFHFILLDLAEISFVDSSGLSAMLIGNRLCNNTQGKFAIVNLQANVQKLIDISQLNGILNIYQDITIAKDDMMALSSQA